MKRLDLLTARQFFADFFYGEHHLPSKIKPWGRGWCVSSHNEVATTDSCDMTRLVMMAHARKIRVAVRPLNFKNLLITLLPYDGVNYQDVHPTMDEATERHLKWNAEHKYPVKPHSYNYVHLPKKMKVYVFDYKNETGKSYDSLAACAKDLGISLNHARLCLLIGDPVREQTYIEPQL